MAEAALSLTVGPSTARLEINAATSGRSKQMGLTVAEAHPASAALLRTQRNSAEPESLHVARDSPHGHANIACELGELYLPSAGGVQPFDQNLLALDPPKRQVSVTGGRGKLSATVHDCHFKPVPGPPGYADTGASGLLFTVGAMACTDDRPEHRGAA